MGVTVVMSHKRKGLRPPAPKTPTPAPQQSGFQTIATIESDRPRGVRLYDPDGDLDVDVVVDDYSGTGLRWANGGGRRFRWQG